MVFQGYIDLLCMSKRSRGIRENPNRIECSVFHMFTCSLMSRERFGVQSRSIYSWKGFETAGDIGCSFYRPINMLIHSELFYVFRFPRILKTENGTDWKINQPMSPAILISFQVYKDLLCTSKDSRDINENPKRFECSIFHAFTFSLISWERFDVHQRSAYPFSQNELART